MAAAKCVEWLQQFKSKNPEDLDEVPNGFLSDVNKESLTVLYNVLIDRYLSSSKVYDHYQFERVGFFTVDQDTELGKIIPQYFDVNTFTIATTDFK
ncbi:hypothetical protein DICVIV_01049 [Dictyocaulus viviparus]|uniref:tRNA synthetases class I (E and Q) anti-codon binding domain-containing protein n=1 Tax=Dictyocaulus viviparus TaxID=29172 RepID=A0A0D8Y7M0_DICVI|nr:hypothetical protein DICVIV_01049 [Dictyocaulus viviparus]